MFPHLIVALALTPLVKLSAQTGNIRCLQCENCLVIDHRNYVTCADSNMCVTYWDISGRILRRGCHGCIYWKDTVPSTNCVECSTTLCNDKNFSMTVRTEPPPPPPPIPVYGLTRIIEVVTVTIYNYTMQRNVLQREEVHRCYVCVRDCGKEDLKKEVCPKNGCFIALVKIKHPTTKNAREYEERGCGSCQSRLIEYTKADPSSASLEKFDCADCGEDTCQVMSSGGDSGPSEGLSRAVQFSASFIVYMYIV